MNNQPRDNYQAILQERPQSLAGGFYENPALQARADEEKRLSDAIADVLWALGDAKAFVLKEGQNGGEGQAQQLIAEIDGEAAEAAGLRVLAPEVLAGIGMPAVDKLRDYLMALKGQLEERLAPIRDAVKRVREQRREAELRAQEAETLRLARGMDTQQVLDYFAQKHNATLRLNKAGQIEIAPAHLATDRNTRALIMLHQEGLISLLRERSTYAVVQ
jgi:hypothetical protein